MTQSQLNRAVSRVTGDDIEVIDHHGFSFVDEQSLLDDDDLEALFVDWDQIQREQTTALFGDRQPASASLY